MVRRSFFLKACDKLKERTKKYKEKAATTKQHSARLVDMQKHVDLSKEKRALLLDMLKNQKCPDNENETILERGAVLYVKYLEVIDTIKADFEREGINYLCITGKVSQKKRGEIVDDFRGDCANKVIIISDAASESVSLHSSNICILYNCPGSSGKFNQTIGRVARFGSKYDTFYVLYVIVEESIDVYSPILLSSKKELEEEILRADYIDLKEQAASFDARVLKEIRQELLWKTRKRRKK